MNRGLLQQVKPLRPEDVGHEKPSLSVCHQIRFETSGPTSQSPVAHFVTLRNERVGRVFKVLFGGSISVGVQNHSPEKFLVKTDVSRVASNLGSHELAVIPFGQKLRGL